MKIHKLPDGRTLLTWDTFPESCELYAAGRDPSAGFSWPDAQLTVEHITLPGETTYEPPADCAIIRASKAFSPWAELDEA